MRGVVLRVLHSSRTIRRKSLQPSSDVHPPIGPLYVRTLWADELNSTHRTHHVRTYAASSGPLSFWPVLSPFHAGGRVASLAAFFQPSCSGYRIEAHLHGVGPAGIEVPQIAHEISDVEHPLIRVLVA